MLVEGGLKMNSLMSFLMSKTCWKMSSTSTSSASFLFMKRFIILLCISIIDFRASETQLGTSIDASESEASLVNFGN